MSSDDPGAQGDGPQPCAKAPPTGSGATNDGGPPQGHNWDLVIDEPLGRMWVCADCGRPWERRYG